MFKEFKEFAVKGNVLDLAIGVIIGAAQKQKKREQRPRSVSRSQQLDVGIARAS